MSPADSAMSFAVQWDFYVVRLVMDRGCTSRFSARYYAPGYFILCHFAPVIIGLHTGQYSHGTNGSNRYVTFFPHFIQRCVKAGSSHVAIVWPHGYRWQVWQSYKTGAGSCFSCPARFRNFFRPASDFFWLGVFCKRFGTTLFASEICSCERRCRRLRSDCSVIDPSSLSRQHTVPSRFHSHITLLHSQQSNDAGTLQPWNLRIPASSSVV